MTADACSGITEVGRAGIIVTTAGGCITARIHRAFVYIEVGTETHERTIHHGNAVDVVSIIIIGHPAPLRTRRIGTADPCPHR